jgi:hypothetical protein
MIYLLKSNLEKSEKDIDHFISKYEILFEDSFIRINALERKNNG